MNPYDNVADIAGSSLPLFARPWGFDRADIGVPVRIWHRGADGNVPIDDGRRLADSILNSEIVVVESAGHLLIALSYLGGFITEHGSGSPATIFALS
ncbi:alpha/beta fold hydrolase [Nocardia sp. CA-129566]|uniref:alpha/beta fold hydrolase n=1 Tax=Nocardia sp. CA-129566 TaxID=3239976 RepID=UPI003D985947